MKQYIKDMTPEEIIQRLKNGEILHPLNPDGYYKMIDGVLCEFYKNELQFINTQIGSVYRPDLNEGFDYYFETKEPFKITESGFYKTKDRSKVYISWIKTYDMDGYNLPEEDYICYGIFEGGDNVFTRNVFGKSNSSSDKLDIISKWED